MKLKNMSASTNKYLFKELRIATTGEEIEKLVILLADNYSKKTDGRPRKFEWKGRNAPRQLDISLNICGFPFGKDL